MFITDAPLPNIQYNIKQYILNIDLQELQLWHIISVLTGHCKLYESQNFLRAGQSNYLRKTPTIIMQSRLL